MEQNQGNPAASIFKPEVITLEFEGKPYRLVYDLNAFCELDTIYGSADVILQLILGVQPEAAAGGPVLVSYNSVPVNPKEIMINNITLDEYMAQNRKSNTKVANSTDTRNLLWAGVLHDHAEYNADGEIIKYTISKAQVGKLVNLSNIKEVNTKISAAILRDLVSSVAKKKRGEAGRKTGAVESSGWNWPKLYYIGTVLFHWEPKRFWRTTPAVLNSLTAVHSELNDPNPKPKVAQTIEEVPFTI